MSKQALRTHHYQWLPEILMHLSAQHVVMVSWRCRVADIHVVMCAKLKEALQPGT